MSRFGMNDNVYMRTLCIRVKQKTPTFSGFTVEVDGRQYLLTAKHAVFGSSPTVEIEYLHEAKWKDMTARRILCEPAEVDIAILCPDRHLTHSVPVELGTAGIIFAQDVFFLGYPLGMHAYIPNITPFAFPFVKKGIVSAIVRDINNVQSIIVDGHNNRGFSGGPLFYYLEGCIKRPKIAGVITSYPHDAIPVYDGEKKTSLTVRENTGILIAHDIQYAIDIIRANPEGFPAPPQQPLFG